MLAVEKSKDLMDQINGIVRRIQHIKQVKTQQFEFLREIQQLYSSFSQRLHKEMVVFEETLIKNSLYAAPKTAYILNFAKIYRGFSLQLQKAAKLNLLSLANVPTSDIAEQQQKLQRKCQLFLKEFQAYLSAEKNYNTNYSIYSDKCALLDQTIRRYRSYQDPVAFYNQTLANEYISELDKHYNDCTNYETVVVNDTQGLDQTRKWMGDHCKEINEYYVILLHLYLRTVHVTINAIVEPPPDHPSPLSLTDSRPPDLADQADLEKLSALYASQSHQRIGEGLAEEYSELFGKGELHSDYRFFYDRCESMRGKRLKTAEEVFLMQSLLVGELQKQAASCAIFDKEYRAIERDIFTNNGIDSFKKRFRKYFGGNLMEAQELCLAVVDRLKRSLDRISKSTDDSREKLKRLCDNKKESIRLFERRTKTLLDDHLLLREKALKKGAADGEVLRIFKESVAQSFHELKKCFEQLDKSEAEIEKLFFSTLKAHCDTILREAVAKNRSRVLEKEKGRLAILRSIESESEVLLILKEDTRYEMLMNECPKPNLYASFQSLAKKKEYDQTKRLLQKKESRLKGMVRLKQGCCCMSTEFIKHNVLSQHPCKLLANGCKAKGLLHVTNAGIIFQESTWLPFSDSLRVMVPQSDIQAFDTRAVDGREAVQVATDFGTLVFQSKVCVEIVESMQKNITFKPGKEGSQKGKRSDSSSFIKNNTSTEFKLSYEKSANHNGSTSDGLKPLKLPVTKSKDLIKDFLKKWREGNFLSDRFTRILKEMPEKSESRRDYQYVNGASRFVLKQRREASMEGKDVLLSYQWKVCFPHSPMLRSFKHSEKVHIEGINKELRVRIVTAPLLEEHLFLRNKFYREIEEMNNRLAKFIVEEFQKEADVLIEPQDEGQKSVNSSDIIIYEVEDRPADLTLRNSGQKSGILLSPSLKQI